MTLPVPTSRPVAFFNLEDEVWGIGCILRELPPCCLEWCCHYHKHWSMAFCLRNCQEKTPLAHRHTLRQREVSLAPEAKSPTAQACSIHKYVHVLIFA